jgi:energy-converting hydrogenase A subunit R
VKKVFVSDCEGPISKNDNAFETASHFIPNGNKLFTVISEYDDVLADVLKRQNHKAGSTLKLILPFLKAYDVTDSKMREFSAQNLRLISNIENTLKHVRGVAHAYIVSTSYEHYIRALCQALEFPYENTYCTRVSIDKYHMTREEKTKLKETAKEISQMPMIEIPQNAKSMKDFSEKHQVTIHRLDEIFWKEIECTDCGRIFSEVDPVGGSEKAESIKDIIRKAGVTMADVMYVGDSITDIEAFRLVRENGGLTISFNGNQYAIKAAEIAVLSENSIVTAVIADVFSRFGKRQTLSLVENWNSQALKKSPVEHTLLNVLFKLFPKELPKVKIITSQNMEILAKDSTEFRKRVRGTAIGRLG